MTTANSKHPGGVNVLRGDGSVSFIKNSVNLLASRPWAAKTAERSKGRTITDRLDKTWSSVMFKCKLIHKLVIAALVAAVAGCADSVPTPPADVEGARTMLKETLEAWKSGRKPEDLKDRSPVVYVVDHDWRGGAKLVDFELDPNGKVVGANLRCQAVLSIERTSGVVDKKTVLYDLTTKPARTVARGDDQ